MLSRAHTLVSLPFGITLQNPILIFATAFLMHLCADTLTHWNIYPERFKRYPFALVALDVFGGLVISYALLGNIAFTLPILSAIAGGNAPDIFHAFWEFAGKRRQKKAPLVIQRFFIFHDHLQSETESIALGLISQVILSGIAIAIILL
jgi:hypothetical protein